MAIHATAQAGFDADAARYARGRPDYPDEVSAWLRDALALGPGKIVVDVGAGTGKFTRRLVKTGAQVIAVEPVAAMRQKLTADLPDVQAIDGSAAAVPLGDASVDAIVCAQAFHWFATPEALAEMHRVLKPGGVLGLIWNSKDDSVNWVRAVSAVTESFEGDAPRFYTRDWQKAFPAPGYGPLVETRFPHAHTGSPETVIVDRLLSVSFIARLSADERGAIAAKLRALIATTPELAGRAEISVPYVTHAFSATRL